MKNCHVMPHQDSGMCGYVWSRYGYREYHWKINHILDDQNPFVATDVIQYVSAFISTHPKGRTYNHDNISSISHPLDKFL